MTFNVNKDLKLILHPYVFVLKEGKKIKEDFLDYSLMVLQLGCLETIPSPQVKKNKNQQLLNDLEILNLNFRSLPKTKTKRTS